MNSYEVQFELPVNNPVSNVGKQVRKTKVVFFVPINHPDAHKMNYQELLEAAALSGRLVLFTGNNKKILKSSDKK